MGRVIMIDRKSRRSSENLCGSIYLNAYLYNNLCCINMDILDAEIDFKNGSDN